jgi:hypothetical protein
MNKLEFFEKLLVYKEDSIKARGTDIENLYSGIIIGMTEAYKILFPDDLFAKDRIKFKDEEGIRFLKARIADLKK